MHVLHGFWRQFRLRLETARSNGRQFCTREFAVICIDPGRRQFGDRQRGNAQSSADKAKIMRTYSWDTERAYQASGGDAEIGAAGVQTKHDRRCVCRCSNQAVLLWRQ